MTKLEQRIENIIAERVYRGSTPAEIAQAITAYLATTEPSAPVAWRVVAEPNLPWSFCRTQEEAEQTAKNLMMYRKGCTSARTEPLYAHPALSAPVAVKETHDGE